MLLWRISNHSSLSGLGAEIVGGRWHTAAPGKRLVYLAEHPAVALIENLVSLGAPPNFLPDHFQLLRVTLPDAVCMELTPEQTASIHPQETQSTQILGDAWLQARTSALLRVPSVPSPESWNYLFNPLHPQAPVLTLEWAKTVTYDQRLFRLSDA